MRGNTAGAARAAAALIPGAGMGATSATRAARYGDEAAAEVVSCLRREGADVARHERTTRSHLVQQMSGPRPAAAGRSSACQAAASTP
ncbi:MAG: hypothetical protein RMJ55_20380, partial [Roseiflexaceae bacterium]|nr:hypothetical protein [Roseiflexaceae bacterium]